MIESIKKLSLALLLLFVTVSFSGCLGIGTSNNAATAPQRNDSRGIFKTADGGQTWTGKNTIEGASVNLGQIEIASMAIDPDNTKVLYVGTVGGGMYKSENGGDSWKKLADTNNKLRASASIYDIAVESGNSSIIYASSLNDNRGVLLKSIDAGSSWSESYITTEKAKQINRVEIDPKEKNVVYIGTEQGGLIRSRDRGDNWQAVRWFDSGVKDFVIDYNNNKGLIVLTHTGLSKTTDGGANSSTSWQDLTKVLTKTKDLDISITKIDSITSMTIDNQNPLMVYMTYQNLIFVTRDGGASWTTLKTITPALEPSKKIPLILKVGTVGSAIYYGSGNAFYKSLDKGQTWSSSNIPLLGNVRCTVSAPNDYNMIYIGSTFQ
jgi:photosystem II stability/assembly factor-like uncharacterized protein